MSIRELSEEEFHATFVSPMRRLGEGEAPPAAVSLSDYASATIDALGLPTTLDEIEVHHVYVANGDRHTHVLFNFGESDIYLVLVIDNRARAVLGHRLLDLQKLYGLKSEA